MENSDTNTKRLRLTNNVRPIKYQLRFEPNKDYTSFLGELKLTLKVTSSMPLETIELHKNKKIDIKSIQIRKLLEDNQFSDPEQGFCIYNEEFRKDVYSFGYTDRGNQFESDTKYLLEISYKGVIYQDACHGVFSCVDSEVYQSSSNLVNQFFQDELERARIENMQINTQFEDTSARKLMPCFDEPSYKALFQLQIIVREPMHQAISNTACVVEEQDDGSREFSFEETPLMSTYLLGIFIGKFDTLTLTTKRGIPVTAYTQSGLSNDAKEMVQIATEAFDFLEDYFQINYPISKVDLISSNRFPLCAMENWGCLLFHRSLILSNRENTSKTQLYNNLRTLCHEVCHQWFGNIVTMEWWDDIWLNEGFARYMEHYVMAELRPEYSVWKEFIDTMYKTSMQTDSFYNFTHAVQVKVEGFEKLHDIFDQISYNKGSSICRMIEGFINDKDVFRKCMRVYMKKFQYQNANTNDLFKVMTQISGKPVLKVFQKWISQQCFPEILITKISETQYKLEQQCFKNQEEGLLWDIPINYVTSKQNKGQFVMDKKEMVFDLPGLETDELIWFNESAYGFYVLRYLDNEINHQILTNYQGFDELTARSIQINYLQLKK
ncbi:puromycin-sensitive aminopeptidase [Stylonychia lemnae]|uniref:Puromycin-sensitive aminopeptidase n=1 Tax=Stylonychia lemnae TaxID=5949 RepID=A0A078B8M1_STYLE|nr:puromycin-sensitive aminopeptidase [Stylonychia lemnae]|eukprot:CDW90551.1 puromycin-sensitive aminopeptidase [Stylonychia lemnae]